MKRLRVFLLLLTLILSATLLNAAGGSAMGDRRTYLPLIAGHVSSSLASTPTPTRTPTSSPTPTPTHTPTSSPTPTPTRTPTSSPTPTPTRTPTSSPTPTPTHTPTSSPTPTPTHTPTSSPTPTPTAPGDWVTLLNEGFEGPPDARWRFFDRDGLTSGEYFWAGRDCRPLTGSASAWAVGGGRDGAALPCGSAYPANADSWMVYGPFSLADAQMAQARFSFYLRALAAGDAFCWGASDNNASFAGLCLDAAPGDWTPFVLDLGNIYGDQPPSASFLGRPQVWIAFRFASDAGNQAAEGVHVDNVLVRKCPDRACTNLPTGALPRSSRATTMQLKP